jgi:hypothetical protein
MHNGGLMAESTNSRNFRTKLSEFFDKAIKKPIAIARGNDRFILVNENEYLALKDEVLSLQKNLIAMLQVNEGKAKTFDNVEEGFDSLFDELAEESYSKEVKNKKAVG